MERFLGTCALFDTGKSGVTKKVVEAIFVSWSNKHMIKIKVHKKKDAKRKNLSNLREVKSYLGCG